MKRSNLSPMMNEVRVRFAPSPTGNLHIGGARTALFNWLYARKYGGKFLLRIEDTDRERSRQEYVDDITGSLKWLGLDWDGELVYQAGRADIHRAAADKLLNEGNAYRCFCDPEALAEEKRIAVARKAAYKYPGYCRGLSGEEVEARLKAGKPYAVRFKAGEGVVVYEDGVHGEIRVDRLEIDDFIIIRSDGSPTYMLSVVVDDMDMGITDVIRGDDHISNTPKQILLHRALGNEPPKFSHLPLILGRDKRRLSKRYGAVSVLEYRRMGILGSALRNYLALLGWSPRDEREVMDLGELIEAFSIEGIGQKSAVFDFDKLEWMNGKYLSAMDDDALAGEAEAWRGEYGEGKMLDIPMDDYFKRALALAKTRMHRISDIFIRDSYYFFNPEDYDNKGVKKHFRHSWLPDRLKVLLDDFIGMEDFDAGAIEHIVRKRAEEGGISAGKLIHPLRLALTGGTVSPGLFELMEVMGKDRVVGRVKRVIGILSSVKV